MNGEPTSFERVPSSESQQTGIVERMIDLAHTDAGISNYLSDFPETELMQRAREVNPNLVSERDIATMWAASRIDTDGAYGVMRGWINQGRCSSEDIAAVFFRMTGDGIF